MAKKIIGGIILVILIAYAAYYGTKVLGANQEQKDLNAAALVMSVGTSTLSTTSTSTTLPTDACTSLRGTVSKYKADIASTTALINQNTSQLNTTQANLDKYNAEMILLDKKGNKLYNDLSSNVSDEGYSVLAKIWIDFLGQEYYPVLNKVKAAKKDIEKLKYSINYNKNTLQGINQSLSKYEPKFNKCLRDNNLTQ